MKKVLYACSYIAALVIGVLMLIFNYQALNSDQPVLRALVIASGVLFIVPAVILLLASLSPKRDDKGEIIKRPWFTTVIAVLALIWGILMICMPSGLLGNLNITLGISLILVGIAQVIWIIKSKESTFWRFIIPILSVCVGIITLTLLNNYPDAGNSAQWAAIVSGLTLVLWGINGFASLRSKRILAVEHEAGKNERKAEKEEKKAEKEEKKNEEKLRTSQPETETHSDSEAADEKAAENPAVKADENHDSQGSPSEVSEKND